MALSGSNFNNFFPKKNLRIDPNIFYIWLLLKNQIATEKIYITIKSSINSITSKLQKKFNLEKYMATSLKFLPYTNTYIIKLITKFQYNLIEID